MPRNPLGRPPKYEHKVNVRCTFHMPKEEQGLLWQIAQATATSKSAVLTQLVRQTADAMGLRVSDNPTRYQNY